MVDPVSLKATVKIPSEYKRGPAYYLDYPSNSFETFIFFETLKHAHADSQRPMKLFTHGFRDSTKETEEEYFVPGEF